MTSYATKPMTYLQLLQVLQQLTPQQLNQDIRFWDMYQGKWRLLLNNDDLVVDDILDDLIDT
jgi:hypothetical protein